MVDGGWMDGGWFFFQIWRLIRADQYVYLNIEYKIYNLTLFSFYPFVPNPHEFY